MVKACCGNEATTQESREVSWQQNLKFFENFEIVS